LIEPSFIILAFLIIVLLKSDSLYVL